MTAPTWGFDSAGFLASNVEIDADMTSVAMTLDNRPMVQESGTWTTSGTVAQTSTARGSEPKLILKDAPFNDFDYRCDVGYGDCLYVRYVDASNWIRVSQYQNFFTSTVACGTYSYSVTDGSICGYYACNPTPCNPVSCNCVNNYAPGNSGTCTTYCYGPNNAYVTTPTCSSGCAQNNPGCSAGCPANYTNGGTTCSYSACTVYTGQTCSTCYSTCYSQCASTCTQYATSYCNQNNYAVSIRLEKMVAGTLSTVQDVAVGTGTSPSSYRCTYLRVVGKGTNIQVFSNLSPTTAHISQTVADFETSRRFGVGRQGLGNQDTGNVLDNLVLKNA